ncbi:nitroreductase/quinone reductase family protein [Streptomyces sp. NPDC001381]|uniref:nitroreductase/quinone reductase family protein n=1 Tax=Streptomyces sp. NPDC001381 TaxID=3364567 RepID=UPI00367BF9FC
MDAGSIPASGPATVTPRPPRVNRVVLAVLRSRWHAALPGLCALTFTGRRSGRPVTLPVQCAHEGDQLVILVGRAAGKRWWRNFTEPRAVRVLLEGAAHEGTGRLVPAGHPGRAGAERIYGRRRARTRIGADDPLVVITLTSGRPPGARPGREGPAAVPPDPAGRRLWARWWRWTTLGEAAGFCVPAAAAAVIGDASAAIGWPVLLAAGAAEGAVLGAAQAHVLHGVLPGLRRGRWVSATAGAAACAWLLGLLPSAVLPRVGFWPVAAGLAVADGLLLLLSLGTAQWWVLRRHVTGGGMWIWATAAAWLAGLAVFCAVSMPLWHPGQSPLLIAAIGVLAGMLMAATVAAVTGVALVRLTRRSAEPGATPGKLA